MAESITEQSDIFQECLSAIEAGKATIEGCIAQYPQYPELGHLLRTAVAAHNLPRPLMPQAAKAKLRQQTLAAFKANTAPIRPTLPTKPIGLVVRPIHPKPGQFPALLRFALVSTLIVGLLFSSGLGLVSASASSVPGDGLYFLKRLVEQVTLVLTPDTARPEVLFQIAQRRLGEVQILTERNQKIDSVFLDEASKSISLALAVQPDTMRRDELFTQTTTIMAQAEAQGAISTDAGKAFMDEVIVGIDAAINAAPPINASNGATETPTVTPSPTMTSTATLTATATTTKALISSPTPLPSATSAVETGTGGIGNTGSTSIPQPTSRSVITRTPPGQIISATNQPENNSPTKEPQGGNGGDGKGGGGGKGGKD
jgi:hypothetical protein